MNMKGGIVNKGLEFYDYVSYVVLDDGEVEANVRLHVGDVIDIKEEEEKDAFAMIRAIVRHKANNGNLYVFLVIDWFEAIGGEDELLRCPYYKLQRPEEMRWRRVYPMAFVDHISNAHFVHCCSSSCTNKHDEINRSYLHNSFFYKTI